VERALLPAAFDFVPAFDFLRCCVLESIKIKIKSSGQSLP
jgi:hypothetical protein